ncbi:MAG: inositol monophosphatase family protein [Dermatophilaceae bacterium]
MWRAHPADPVLWEEDADDLVRLASRRVWVIDPLDGTRESHDLARSDWAVHVALVVDGVPVAGAVALPGRGLTLATHPAPGPLPPLPSRVRLVVSRTAQRPRPGLPPPPLMPTSIRWGPRAPRRRRWWCSGKPKRMCTTVVSTNGTRRHPSPWAWPWPRASTSLDSTGPRFRTTRAIRGLLICSFAGPRWRTRSSPPPGEGVLEGRPRPPNR